MEMSVKWIKPDANKQKEEIKAASVRERREEIQEQGF